MFLANFGAYDVQFEGFGGDYVFWAGSAQSEGRRHKSHASVIRDPTENQRSPPDGIWRKCAFIRE